VIDVEANKIVKEVSTAPEPEGVLVSESGNTIYVASEVGDLVHVIDANTNTIAKNILVDSRPRRFVATPDGKELWVSAELSGVVDVIDRKSLAVTGTISFLPHGMRKSDGKTAYITLGHAAHVAVVDVATHKVEGYILVGQRPWGITLSRDDRTLYVANGLGDDVTVIDTKSRQPIVSVPVGQVPYGIAVDD
jgi:YVTN family beta-propeller protein